MSLVMWGSKYQTRVTPQVLENIQVTQLVIIG